MLKCTCVCALLQHPVWCVLPEPSIAQSRKQKGYTDTIRTCTFILVVVVVVPGFELRDLNLLGSSLWLEPHSQPFCFRYFSDT
jgi:predicted cupin superfamily sugar epimerase